MQYVMVPVPSEHVAEVLRWVLFRIPEEDTEGSVRHTARLTKLVEQADALTRSVLILVAKATLDGTAPVRLSDAADELGHSAQSLRAALRALNTPENHENVRNLVRVSEETTIGVHGGKAKTLVVSMRAEDARILRNVAKAIDAQDGGAPS